jgi:hypothetical protein
MLLTVSFRYLITMPCFTFMVEEVIVHLFSTLDEFVFQLLLLLCCNQIWTMSWHIYGLVDVALNMVGACRRVWFKHKNLLDRLNEPSTCYSQSLDRGGIPREDHCLSKHGFYIDHRGP